MDDAPFQQAHEETSSHRQIVAVFGIGVDLYRLDDSEVPVIIIPPDNASGLEYLDRQRTCGNIHLKLSALVVFNIPQERGKAVADRLQRDRQRIAVRYHFVDFDLHRHTPR